MTVQAKVPGPLSLVKSVSDTQSSPKAALNRSDPSGRDIVPVPGR